MEITTSNLNLFFTALDVKFGLAYKTTPVWYKQLATEYPVSTEQWADAWTGMLERVREWTGPRVVHTPAPQTYLVAIQKYELTWGIDRTKIEDDQHQVYYTHFANHGKQNAKWPDYELRDLIFNRGSQTGPRQNGTDALTHWHASHPVDFYDSGKGTYCNDYRSGGVVVDGVLTGGGLSTGAFNTVWNDMSLRKSESGEALGVEPDLLAVSSSNKATAALILNTQFIATPQVGNQGTGLVGTANAPMVGASENVLKGWTDTLVVKDFGVTSSTRLLWLMLQTKDMPVMPFSFLLRNAPVVTPRTRPDDPIVFDTDQFMFGSRMRGSPAWSLPFLSSIAGP